MKSVIKLSLIIALLFSFPASAFMEDVTNQGKIIINVYDENNKPFSGDWALYKGRNEKGFLVRNGSSSEKFNIVEGVYFLVVYRKDHIHPYHVINSTNPQTLAANETITFNAQYFKTEEEMANPTAPVATEPAPAEPFTTTVTPDTSEMTESVDASADEPDTTESPLFSRTYMGPRVTTADLPDTNVSPATDASASSDGSASLPMQLAETGSPALLLFVISGLLGSIAARRRKV